LTLCLLLTGLATSSLLVMEERREVLRFQNQVDRAQRLIEDRMEVYLALLRATGGLFAVHEPVDGEELQTFVSKLELQKHYPGLEGIGFSHRAAPAEAGLFTEPGRAAMERARDSGAPALTGKVTPAREVEAKQPSFLLYLPVYSHGLPLDTVEERRAALLGFVYSPFRADPFLRETLGPERLPGIAVEVHAGREALPENLLYRSGRASQPRFVHAGTFEIGGSPWTLKVSSLPSFESSAGRLGALIVFLTGLLTSGILFALSRSQVNARMTAEEAAVELRRSEEATARLYEAERLARAEAEAANHAKDRFMASLSHELRTPLTPVLAVIASLEKEVSLLVNNRLATVRRNVELEARLIDDLLDVARISRGKLELKPEVADLREVVGHALDACCPAGESKRARFEIDLPEGEDLRLWADAPRLTQVFWNLMTNALKFTPEGPIRVRAWKDEATGEISAEVSDRGIGIEPQRLSQIFDAFEQGQRSITRQYGGLGLGLAITQAIVELHGGRIEAESDGPGQGATFRLWLPVGAAHLPARGPDQPLDRPAAAAAPPAQSDRPLHILLVEDHSDTADAMEALLSVVGYRVTVAGNARDALATAEAAAIDLVISDVGLPDASGLELMAQLKSRFQLRGIALTGYGMEEDLQRSREAGFERHLTKPVSPQALQDAIREVASQPPMHR
jgi:signal transduction histidine kinase/ActR/RegA family two-component response regulator